MTQLGPQADSNFFDRLQLPNHWQVVPLKFALSRGQEGVKIGPFGSALRLETLTDTGLKVYGQENVIQADFGRGHRHVPLERASEFAQYLVRPGDLLVTMMGTAGRCEVVPQGAAVGILDSHLLRLRVDPGKLHPEFLRWFLNDSAWAKVQLDLMGGGSIMHGLNSSIVKNVSIGLPPMEEQGRIVAFLDHETARIDELVREQERLSDLAGQKRIASIRELTHFGPSQGVELQSTGIDWIPQVPTHWRLSQIGFEARVGNGSTPARENASYWQDGDIPWMNSSKINEVFITGADQFVSQKALQECHLPRVPAGSVLIAITGEGRTRGLSAITGIDTTINQHLAYVSVTSGGLLPEYLRYYLEGQYEHLRHESSGTGSTRAALTCGFIQKYPVPVPPLAEQQSIVDVLNRDLSQLSSLVENAETMKQLLLERRSALISAAVTGQLDLSDWQLPEPEAVAEVA